MSLGRTPLFRSLTQTVRQARRLNENPQNQVGGVLQSKRVSLLVIAGIALCATVFPASADPPTIVRAPDFVVPVSGSCKEFAQATVRGVHDDEGVFHTGDCGFTRFRPKFNGLDQADFSDALKQGLFEASSLVKVESFPGDPRRDTGRFCARAYDFSIDLGAEVQISFLDWHHGKKPDSACAKEWERLKQIIRTHEEKHVNDVKPVLNAAVGRLRGLNIINCAATNEDALDGLKPMLAAALNAWFKSINDDWDARQRTLDSGGDRCAIDCSKCKHTGYWHKAESYLPPRGTGADTGMMGGSGIGAGVVCDLEKPFTLPTYWPSAGGWHFTPSNSRSGSVSYDEPSSNHRCYGSGSYKITELAIGQFQMLTMKMTMHNCVYTKNLNYTGCEDDGNVLVLTDLDLHRLETGVDTEECNEP